MRRIKFAVMAGVLAASLAMTACGSRDKAEDTTNQTTGATVETTTESTDGTTGATTDGTNGETTDGTTEGTTEETTEETTGAESKEEVSVEDLAAAIKEAYGDMYLPSMQVDAEMAKEMYGVDTTWHEEFFGEIPMMSAHVDMLLIFKAADGHVEDIEEALANYRDVQINDSMQYPSNMPKLQASVVKTYDDYVFFIMLGGYPDDQQTDDEELALQYAEENNQIAIDTIENLLK
ncbi:MAG: DUF4358 domain-containing protein [Lachnospiraceae bacterium]|nr:DUF4358 domain-containing protein [Lachnospiraceae bacterium]